MLTVMHRHNDGTETIYEATSVTRETLGEPTIPPWGDIVVHGTSQDGAPSYTFVGLGACCEDNGRVRISAKWMDPKGFDESMVFVMNRFGQTVARHRMTLRLSE